MPKIFHKNGFTFSFYSNDRLPIHVHVFKDGGEARFNIEPVIELVESVGLRTRELAVAEEMIEENRELIIQSWNKFFNP